jgi:aspartyl protease family protein
MTENQSLNLLMAVLMLVLVASGLFARRLPVGQMARMLLMWIGIFAFGFLIFSFRHEAKQVWQRVKAEVSPGGSLDSNGELRITKGEDGHFWVNAEMNGTKVRLMVDSGATTTALSSETAKSANIEVDQSGFPVIIGTANGNVEAWRARIAKLRVGPIERNDLAVVVATNFGDTNVIGMNFLSSLESWRVEGDTLILNPKGGNSSGKGPEGG